MYPKFKYQLARSTYIITYIKNWSPHNYASGQQKIIWIFAISLEKCLKMYGDRFLIFEKFDCKPQLS